jgi:hypothetical protein
MRTICCTKCQGSGTVEMPRHLSETLDFLAANPDSTSLELRDAIAPKLTVTAMNNRLDDLEKMGLVAWEKTSQRYFTWRLK